MRRVFTRRSPETVTASCRWGPLLSQAAAYARLPAASPAKRGGHVCLICHEAIGLFDQTSPCHLSLPDECRLCLQVYSSTYSNRPAMIWFAPSLMTQTARRCRAPPGPGDTTSDLRG